jgi:hydroxyacylglutathione hydrolase
MEDIKIIRLTFVNAFLIRAGEDFILIDTGLSMHWEKLENELIDSGALPDKLRLVLLTHGDADHAGNCKHLKEKYGVSIAMHKADAPMVANGLLRKRKIKSLRNKLFALIKKLFSNKFDHDKFNPDIYLAEGQNLNEYGLDATVFHIPGHTHGSIGILTAEGNFFAGDTFINNKRPAIARLIENQYELKTSLARIKKLNIRTIYPGHGKPFEMARIIDKF